MDYNSIVAFKKSILDIESNMAVLEPKTKLHGLRNVACVLMPKQKQKWSSITDEAELLSACVSEILSFLNEKNFRNEIFGYVYRSRTDYVTKSIILWWFYPDMMKEEKELAISLRIGAQSHWVNYKVVTPETINDTIENLVSLIISQ